MPTPTTPDGELFDDTLRKAGWIGAGEAALQFHNRAKHALLRAEYHADVPEVHFHVTDDSDCGLDFVLRPKDRLPEMLKVLVELQSELCLGNLKEPMPPVVAVCREAYAIERGTLRTLLTVEGHPAASEAWNRGVTQANEGRFAEAAASFEEVQGLIPGHEKSLEYLSVVYRNLEDFPRMRRAAAAWTVGAPRNPEAWFQLSIALQNVSLLPDALAAIDQSVTLGRDGTHHYQRACVLALLDRIPEGLASARTALDCDPSLGGSMADDPDLARLREVPEFQTLFRRS